MPVEAELIYKSREQIVEDLMTALSARIPDIHLGEDGVARAMLEVFAGELEGVYLANQILRDNMFIQTADIIELERWGEVYGHPLEIGTVASGDVIFSGAGGTIIEAGASIAAFSGAGDLLYFVTMSDATIPNPGIPNAPVIADGGAGAMDAGTYEYVVTFVTLGGETIPGPASNALVQAAAKQVDVAAIQVGGTGTTARKLYRQKDGGGYKLVTTINDNVTTIFDDNTVEGALGGAPPIEGTAEKVTVPVESETFGEAYNVVINTITELVEVPNGVTGVTNPATFTGGSDEQDMEEYRSDLLEHVRNPMTGSVTDLVVWAKHNPAVAEATVFENDNLGTPQNGHATVRISGPGGSVPDAGVIAEVQEELDMMDMANITIHVTTFTGVPTNVTADVTVVTGFTLAEVTPTVQDAIADYINSVEVGGTIYLAGLVDAVFGQPGILTVAITSPATDQTSTATEKRTPGTITVI